MSPSALPPAQAEIMVKDYKKGEKSGQYIVTFNDGSDAIVEVSNYNNFRIRKKLISSREIRGLLLERFLKSLKD